MDLDSCSVRTALGLPRARLSALTSQASGWQHASTRPAAACRAREAQRLRESSKLVSQ